MNKITSLSTLALLIASTQSYAHHPAVDMVDPEVYAMIEENISEVHLAMTFDDMGGNSADAGSEMTSRADEVDNMGSEMAARLEDIGAEMGANMEDVGAEMASREEMSSMANIEPTGSMNGQRR